MAKVQVQQRQHSRGDFNRKGRQNGLPSLGKLSCSVTFTRSMAILAFAGPVTAFTLHPVVPFLAV